MMQLALGGALMLILAAMLLLLPRRPSGDSLRLRQQANVAAFREQLAELQVERDSGLIDDALHAQLRSELEHSLLADASEDGPRAAPRTSGAMAIWLAAAALLGIAASAYWHLGHWADVDIRLRLTELRERFDQGLDVQSQTQALLVRAEARAEQTPANDELWALIAQTASATGQVERARRAYVHLASKYPEDANAAAYAAQAAYGAAGGKMTSEVGSYLERALALDPAQPTALALRGMSAFQQGHYQVAVDAWERMLVNSEPGSDQARMVRAGIRKARELLGAPMPAELPVRVRLEVPAGLRTSPDQVVYVGVRLAGGRGQPMLAARLKLAELPVELSMDERFALSAARVPLQGDRVDVFARISSTGDAAAAAGDIEGEVANLLVDASSQVPRMVIGRVLTEQDLAQRRRAEAVRVRVSLAPGVQARPDQKVFVVVRALDGAPVPLAVRTIAASELPLELELTDADSMSPQARISSVSNVSASAKLSATGRADPDPADVRASPVELEVGRAGPAVELVIGK